MREPIVRTIRQPPLAVPSAIALWQLRTTQSGTWNAPVSMPWEYSSTVMIPIVFWASLPPWARLSSAEDTNCSTRKRRSTANGVDRTASHDVASTSSIASSSPISGDSTIAEPMIPTPPQTTAAGPALAIAAPSSPPTKAWLLLEGIPSRHVSTFHTIAPASAPKITNGSTIAVFTTPLPIVWATCRPNTVKAMKLKNEAQSTAVNGRSTRVATTVAIELALSCNPLRKSNSSAVPTRATRTGVPTRSGVTTLDLLDHNAVDHVDDVLAAIHDGFDQVVDLLHG